MISTMYYVTMYASKVLFVHCTLESNGFQRLKNFYMYNVKSFRYKHSCTLIIFEERGEGQSFCVQLQFILSLLPTPHSM